MFELLYGVAPFAALLFLAWLVGTLRERSHLKRLDRREAEAADMLVTNLRTPPDMGSIREAAFVSGSVVIGTDYFKTFIAALRKLIGGEIVEAESLMLRARREALLRMMDEARSRGAREIHNVRYVSCNIAQMSGNKGAMAVELCAYGTAVFR